MIDLKTPEAKAYIQSLQQQGYAYIMPMSSRQYACLAPFIYTTAIITGKWFGQGLEDRWCYDKPEKALVALMAWAIDGFQNEPQGWHRHHRTGRRRPDGDASKEYINW